MSLESWLKDIGLSRIGGVLEDFGITSVKDLPILRESDLQDIIKELDLKPRDKIRFKVAVRKVEGDDGRRVVLTPEEDKAIKSLSSLSKIAKESLLSIEKTMEEVRQNGEKAQKDIADEFLKYMKHLKNRETFLISEIDLKQKQKLKVLETQCKALSNVISELAEAKLNSDKLLQVASIDALECREKSIAAEVTKISQLTFPKKPATNSEIKYEAGADSLDQAINKHGQIVAHEHITPPEIWKIETTHDTIQCFWQTRDEPGAPDDSTPIRFALKVSEICSTSTEGEQRSQKEFEWDGKQENYSIKNLKADSEYEISLKAKNKLGWSSYGEPSTARTEKIPLPKLIGFSRKHIGSGLKLSNRNLTVLNTHKDCWETAYTNQDITTGKYEWNVRVDRSEGGLMVGIAKTSCLCVQMDISSSGYSYKLNGSRLYGIKRSFEIERARFAVGDIVSVVFNADERTISFKKNGNFIGSKSPHLTDVDQHYSYYFAVSLYDNTQATVLPTSCQ